jgi:hypothetical protein
MVRKEVCEVVGTLPIGTTIVSRTVNLLQQSDRFISWIVSLPFIQLNATHDEATIQCSVIRVFTVIL